MALGAPARVTTEAPSPRVQGWVDQNGPIYETLARRYADGLLEVEDER
jgi:hypothetical protein